MAMLIDCPHCGKRTTDEFYVKGDASKVRPAETGKSSIDAWHDYVNIRDNIRGRIAEYWHHTGGCRQWVVVERDSMTHEVYGVTPAQSWKPGSKKSSAKRPVKRSRKAKS